MSNRLLGNARVWDFVARQAKSDNNIFRGGWRNSYNGEYFSEEEMNEYADDVYEKLKHYLDKSTVCLEIGCSSGITMYRIAPYVAKYIGIDQAKKNLQIDEKMNEEHGINNIELHLCRAEDIERFQGYGISVIIINSVCQYFDDEKYMIDVLKKCRSILQSGGIIYCGDIRDADLFDDYLKSLYEYKEENDNRFVSNAIENAKNGSELFFAKRFFEDLTELIPEIETVNITHKIGNIENEMTRFRYDVVLRCNTEN